MLLLGASTPPHLLLMMFISLRENKCLKFHVPVPFNSFGEEIAEQEENEFDLMIFLRTWRMLNLKLFIGTFFEIKA